MKMGRHTRRLVTGLTVGIVVVCASAAGFAADAKAQPKLTQLVGDDVGLCLELHDLAGNVDRFTHSEMFRRLQAIPGIRQILKSSEFGEMLKIKKQLEMQQGEGGRSLEELATALFGKTVVFAVYPNGKAGPSGVMLLRASDMKSLDHALKLWNRLDPGQKTDERSYEGVRYYRRSRRDGQDDSQPTLFYGRLDRVLVLSDREEMIRKVLKLKTSKKSLTTLPAYRNSQSAVRGKPVITAFLNPRTWDSALRSPASESDVPVPLQFWRSCHWMLGTVRLENGVVVDAVFDYDARQLPEFWRNLLKDLSGSSALLERVPGDALLTIAGRYSPAIIRTLFTGTERKPADKNTRNARLKIQALLSGFDVVDGLLPRLNRDIAFFVVGRNPRTANQPPYDALFAAGISPEKQAANKWSAELEYGLSGALQVAAVVYNMKLAETIASDKNITFAKVQKQQIQGIAIHSVNNLAGFQPGFAVTSHAVLIGGSPRIIRQFTGEKNAQLLKQTAFMMSRKQFFPEFSQLIFINTRLASQHLRKNLPAIARAWLKSKSVKEAQAEPALRIAAEFLGVADSVFFASHITDSRIRLTLGMVAEPAK